MAKTDQITESGSNFTPVLIEDVLSRAPRPYYLTEARVAPDNLSLESTALFPSSDVTVGDRIDHVNVSHHLFGLWNAAHILASRNGYSTLRTRRGEWQALKETPPDTPISLNTTISQVHYLSDNVVTGRFTGQYSLDGEVLATYKCNFVAYQGQE